MLRCCRKARFEGMNSVTLHTSLLPARKRPPLYMNISARPNTVYAVTVLFH